MNKKVLLVGLISILIIAGLFVLTGCNNKEEEGEIQVSINNQIQNRTSNKTSKNNSDTEGVAVNLSNDTTFMNMHYKENVADFYSDTMGNNRVIRYSENGKTVSEIKMAYVDGDSIDQLKGPAEYTITPKEVKNIEYQYGEWEANNAESEEPIRVHQYFYTFDGKTYSIAFYSNEDISEFEQSFMDDVSFK